MFKLVRLVLGYFRSLEFFLVVLRCIRLCLVGGCCFKLIRLDLRYFWSLEFFLVVVGWCRLLYIVHVCGVYNRFGSLHSSSSFKCFLVGLILF